MAKGSLLSRFLVTWALEEIRLQILRSRMPSMGHLRWAQIQTAYEYISFTALAAGLGQMPSPQSAQNRSKTERLYFYPHSNKSEETVISRQHTGRSYMTHPAVWTPCQPRNTFDRFALMWLKQRRGILQLDQCRRCCSRAYNFRYFEINGFRKLKIFVTFWSCFCFTCVFVCLFFLNWRCASFNVYISFQSLLYSNKMCFAFINPSWLPGH